ncbi:MAG: hypothetical protein CMN73_06180 [Sphingomonas sp.]|nr:hypothetical protein [Sphingomonas sp.]|tara:strand:+ start:262 stop:783 length:522 start_codon:yes stop_codon:yes gene_type:complete
MPIFVYENEGDEDVTFILSPKEEEFRIPPLARIGVRYEIGPGQCDRTFLSVGRHLVTFWCEAAVRETEIVFPGPFDLLLASLARRGFCGGIVNDQPTHVCDLLPASGMISAEAFSTLVLRAEGDGNDLSRDIERWLDSLKALFIEHMGSDRVPVALLRQNVAQPFDAVVNSAD